MVLRKKNFNILEVHWKIQLLGAVHEKPISRGDCLKRRGEQFVSLRGGLGRKEGYVFLRGVWYPKAYHGNIAVNIWNATQLEVRECYSGRHVIQSWVTAELPVCHKHSHWLNIVILITSRTLNMSWTHQSLVHHCHVSHLHNFEHAIALAQQLWAHHCHVMLTYHHPRISHYQNTIPWHELSSHADVISYHQLKDTATPQGYQCSLNIILRYMFGLASSLWVLHLFSRRVSRVASRVQS